jgi:phosphopentomutase
MVHYFNYPTKKNNVIVQANFPEGDIGFGHRFDPYGRQIYYVDAIIVAIFKCKPKLKP